MAPFHPASRRPPGGLLPSQCPQFIVVGCDDNQHADGIAWVMEAFSGKKNPAGSGSASTFDGAPVRLSFYTTPVSPEDPARCVGADVVAAWKAAFQAGHEMANHAWSHAHGSAFAVERWMEEIKRCGDFISENAGIPRERIAGFRAPFLEYNGNAFAAARLSGMRYDTSVQLGWEACCDGGDNYWPFTLDAGLPESGAAASGNHPGLWEIPVDPAHFPPGLGLGNTKVTGFDWNLWFPGGGVTQDQFTAVFKHTLDLKYRGNRAPMNLALHSYIYSAKWAASADPAAKVPRSSLAERQAAVREFVDYALSLPDVRLVGAESLLNWMENPSPLFH
jgi:hypothetical protein